MRVMKSVATKLKKRNLELNFIDLFSGAGGLSNGMESAGWTCLLGLDMNKYALETFKANHHHAEIFHGNIQDLDTKTLKKLTKNKTIHAVVGGPPCQGFSTVGPGDPKDKRNHLFKEFVRIVKATKPEFIVVENVTGLLAKKNEKTLKSIFEEFNQLGYFLDVQVMSSDQYGVAETRRRTIILGSRITTKIQFPRPTHNIEKENKFIPAVTVGEVFKNLKTTNGKIFNHDIEQSLIKSLVDQKRIAHIPEGKGIRYKEDEVTYLPKPLRLGVNWNELRENRFRQTKFQRLHRKKTSPTIMTHRHNYFHPVENRYLTQREAAAIQSFPNDFVFYGPLSEQWRQIGNAVPPLLGFHIGNALIEMRDKKAAKIKLTKNILVKNFESVRETAFLYKKKPITKQATK